jgi:ankyrin repeat protein
MTTGGTINCQFAMKMLKCCYSQDPLLIELILKTNLINLNTKKYVDQYINSITDLKIAMQCGFDILFCDNYLFHLSLYNGKVDIVKYLLSLNVDPCGNIHYPAIISASVQGLDDIVKLLLDHPNINPTIQNNQALYLTLNMKRINVVNILLSDKRINTFNIISNIDEV